MEGIVTREYLVLVYEFEKKIQPWVSIETQDPHYYHTALESGQKYAWR